MSDTALAPVRIRPRTEDSKDSRRMFINLMATLYRIRLTDAELSIITELVHEHKGKITTEIRRKVCEALQITSYNLSNRFKDLREKGVLQSKTVDGKELEFVNPAYLTVIDSRDLIINL